MRVEHGPPTLMDSFNPLGYKLGDVVHLFWNPNEMVLCSAIDKVAIAGGDIYFRGMLYL
jgi:hypothetical protein